jgi:hypothetical protein
VVPTRFEFHPMLPRLYRNSNQFIEAFDEEGLPLELPEKYNAKVLTQNVF